MNATRQNNYEEQRLRQLNEVVPGLLHPSAGATCLYIGATPWRFQLGPELYAAGYLAALLDKINSEREEHILTIEDPIEYIHQHKRCVVNQREVYSDTRVRSGLAGGAARGSRHRSHR